MDRAATEQALDQSLAWVRQQVVGRWTRTKTPFGPRLITHADVTATGRHLHFVDTWVQRARPYYATTHTAVSSTGSVLTELRESARELVRRGVSAGRDDVVLFVGSGAAAALDKLITLLGWRIPEPLERKHGLSRSIPPQERPVVFAGPFEQHSALRPWLESIAEVVEIGVDAAGAIDLAQLDARLVEHARRPLRVGSFSAASSMTGVLADMRAIARVLHRRGALAFFDYATAGPYVPIDMHPASPDERIDALFVSTHRFIGGPEASGVLVAHRSLLRAVTPEHADTPSILDDLRTGAAFLVKEMLGAEGLLQREQRIARRTVARLAQHPRIHVLGPETAPRLAIVSLTLDNLHHELVSLLLDHLFGIQSRAGHSSGGDYGDILLGIDRPTSARYQHLARRGLESMRPGWLRLSLPYYFNDDDVEFVLSAVEFVAQNGETFLPLYRLNWRDGMWRHLEGPAAVPPGLELTREALEQLAAVPFAAVPEPPLPDHELRAERKRYFDQARDLAVRLAARWRAMPPAWNRPTTDPEVDELVWFRYALTDGHPNA